MDKKIKRTMSCLEKRISAISKRRNHLINFNFFCMSDTFKIVQQKNKIRQQPPNTTA